MAGHHWIERVARQAGFPQVDTLEVPADSPIQEAWAAVEAHCGITPDQLRDAVAEAFRLPAAILEAVEPAASKLLPASVARRYLLFPLRAGDHRISIGTADPTDVDAEKEAGFVSSRSPAMEVAHPAVLLEHIEATYSPEQAAENLLGRMEASVGELVEFVDDAAHPELSAPQEDDDSGPLVRLTNMILQEAVEKGASDIHIQPLPGSGIVRYRVDGVLRPGVRIPIPVLHRVISRVKIMSRLDIADRLRPQDGRAKIMVGGRTYDLRISTVPARNAEKAVIRILDPIQTGGLDDTGIPRREVDRLRRVLRHRDGILVITGPTGSGKTTTMYSALKEIATEDVNIMTVEDPVEYELPGLTQIQVESKQGVTFASALRAILRQDPDIIFLGEIRDEEAAEIAAQASLTGHLVLATVHANDAVGAIRRFMDLGLDAATISETLRGALAQRLVRRVCPECAEPAAGADLPEGERVLADRYGIQPPIRTVGCESCGLSGFRGRIPVVELIVPSPRFQRMVAEEAPYPALAEQAREDGMRGLFEAAMEIVEAGTTTLEEVERVVGDEEGSGQDPESLPSEETPPTAVPAVQAAESEESSPSEAPHVLLVDDDPGTRLIARRVLEKEGWQATEAEDGGEALVALAKGTPFDLMVLDLDMPTLGGREVLQATRKSFSTSSLPIIVLTATLDPTAEIKLMEDGADDFIRKPIGPPLFLTRVKAVLRRATG
ncbi:ATPase, T2SS/T4P/T4SS family [Gemmatimonadota bacterium]